MGRVLIPAALRQARTQLKGKADGVPANLGRLVATVSNLQQRCLICPLRCQVIAYGVLGVLLPEADGRHMVPLRTAFSAAVTGEPVSRGWSHANVRSSSMPRRRDSASSGKTRGMSLFPAMASVSRSVAHQSRYKMCRREVLETTDATSQP